MMFILVLIREEVGIINNWISSLVLSYFFFGIVLKIFINIRCIINLEIRIFFRCKDNKMGFFYGC